MSWGFFRDPEWNVSAPLRILIGFFATELGFVLFFRFCWGQFCFVRCATTFDWRRHGRHFFRVSQLLLPRSRDAGKCRDVTASQYGSSCYVTWWTRRPIGFRVTAKRFNASQFHGLFLLISLKNNKFLKKELCWRCCKLHFARLNNSIVIFNSGNWSVTFLWHL